jgi:hypothetical protein
MATIDQRKWEDIAEMDLGFGVSLQTGFNWLTIGPIATSVNM